VAKHNDGSIYVEPASAAFQRLKWYEDNENSMKAYCILGAGLSF